jgi:hypothetical protein
MKSLTPKEGLKVGSCGSCTITLRYLFLDFMLIVKKWKSGVLNVLGVQLRLLFHDSPRNYNFNLVSLWLYGLLKTPNF